MNNGVLSVCLSQSPKNTHNKSKNATRLLLKVQNEKNEKKYIFLITISILTFSHFPNYFG